MGRKREAKERGKGGEKEKKRKERREKETFWQIRRQRYYMHACHDFADPSRLKKTTMSNNLAKRGTTAQQKGQNQTKMKRNGRNHEKKWTHICWTNYFVTTFQLYRIARSSTTMFIDLLLVCYLANAT